MKNIIVVSNRQWDVDFVKSFKTLAAFQDWAKGKKYLTADHLKEVYTKATAPVDTPAAAPAPADVSKPA